MDKVERLSAELKQLTQEIEDQRAVLSQDASTPDSCQWCWKDGSCCSIVGLQVWLNMV